MFFFILLSIILLLFCLYLYFDNKKLKEKITNLEEQTKEILKRKISKKRDEDLISIEKISKEEPKQLVKEEKITPKKEIKTEEKITNKKYKAKPNKPEPVYKIVKPTIPSLAETKKNKEQKITKESTINIDEFINNKTKKISSDKYLKEVTNKLADELKPRTIELTDYEQKEEEQAVISYKELLALKEKIENNNHDENFLEDLKEFRKLLD